MGVQSEGFVPCQLKDEEPEGGSLEKSPIFIGATEEGGKLYTVKEGIPSLSQEKGRNVILNEGFPWKEKAEEGGIRA